MPRMSTASGSVSKPGGNSHSHSSCWKDVHSRVRDWRRTFVHLFVKVPTEISFRKLGPNHLRCYFLLSPGQGRESSLYYADINLDQVADSNSLTRIPYQELLDCGNSFLWRRTSKEEQLLSERRRISTWGIINYELHASSGTLVFPAASTIFQCVHPERPSGPVGVKELSSSKVRLNPQICPSNHNMIAFSARYDIYIYNTQTGEEKRVTHSHSGGKLENDPKSCGVPSYVMQEEFGRFQGYWWQPCSSDGIYRLLYEEIDESCVPIVQFISPDDTSGLLEEFRFPRAGTENAKSYLRLIEVSLSSSDEMRVTYRNLIKELDELAPWFEYLVRVGWTPDGSQVWCQLLDRKQQRLELVLLPLTSFIGLKPVKANSIRFSPYSLVSFYSNTWVDVHNMLYWFSSSTDVTQKMFIMASEETGYRHLYFYIVQLHPMINSNGYDTQEEQILANSHIIQKIALTSGQWCVLTNGLWVDENHGLVYFMAVKDTPLEQHLYVTSLSRPGVYQLLTPPDYSHQAYLNDDCSVFATVFSSKKSPSQSKVFRISAASLSSEHFVWVTCIGDLVSDQLSEPLLEIMPYCVPKIIKSNLGCGTDIYSMVFMPHDYVPGKKCPTVLNIYGGPQVQLVSNTFKGFRHMRTHMLAAHGFCVVSIDSRGSDNRGVDFQSYIFSRMGTVEIDDQIEVLKSIANQCDCIDLTRLAVFGWSYGGYLSLMALAQRPDYFKLAIAGAPVVSWNLYDTGYTERYMGLPSSNPSGYRNGSVLSYIHNFPDQENRLLIVQGMIDENVHFFHTNQLIQSLIKAGKPYQLQIYPRERHCLRQLDSNEHYETKLLCFLLENL